MMDYLTTMEDGSSACLSHHGVKGMKWGVWNEETKAKYTIGKGSTIRRLTSVDEAKKGTDLSRKFYASQNQRDFDLYAKSVDTLPSTSKMKNGKLPKKVGLVSYEAVDDIVVAKGKTVLNDILKDYGNSSLKSIYDDYGLAEERESAGLKNRDLTVNDVWKNAKLSEAARKDAGRRLVAEVMGSEKGNRIAEKYKKQGYDAIEDAEDLLSANKDFNPTNPLIILNGNKFKVSDTQIVNKKKLPKYETTK